MQRDHCSFIWLVGLLALAGLCSSPPIRAVTLQQVVSRENTAFNLTTNELGVGLDGKVYISNWNQSGGNSYIMRINTDGTQKGGSVESTESAQAVAANASGIIATANAHFAHSVNIYDANFNLLATQNLFNGSNFDEPADVEVGASGNFYGLDQHNNQIICMNTTGQILATYPYPAQSNEVISFRVCESSQRFILWVLGGSIISVGFNGTQYWSNGSSGLYWWDNQQGGMDLDASGNLYTIGQSGTAIQKWDVNDNLVGTYTLTNNPGNTAGGNLRITGSQAIIRYGLNSELFRVFTLSGSTATYVRTVVPYIDTLTATYSSETWTAGAVTPFTLSFTSTNPAGPTPSPIWHVWGRPCDSAVTVNGGQTATTYQDFGYSSSNQTITVPTGCTGLYDIKVTPEQSGWQRGTQSEYWLHDIVEIRTPSAVGAISVYTVAGTPITGSVAVTNGSANVVGTGTSFPTALAVGNIIVIDGQSMTIASITDNTHLAVSSNFTLTASGMPLYLCASTTTNNRLHYNAGDQIPFTVSVRCPTANLPASVTINLTDANSNIIASGSASISSSQTTAAFFIPSAVTAGLNPGSYTLKATNAGFTCVPQPLIIGAGLQKPPFRFILYGDYGPNYVNGLLSQERDLVANQGVELKKVCANMVVDRLGYTPSSFLSWPNGQGTDGQDLITTVQSRLNSDSMATDPAKAAPEPPLQQTVAAYSAGNTEEMSILMYNDAGIPLGSGFDNRTSIGQFQTDTTTMTDALLPYASFRGWVWAANWWNFWHTASGQNGITGMGATSQTQLNQYNADVSTAQSTGVWNASGTGTLDTVANTRLNYGANIWSQLATTPVILNNPQLVQATANPIRHVDGYPPFNFSPVQESDMQAQWEQYEMPYHTMWNVDYHLRPGKKGWEHPEVWNDAGTGEQILRDTFMGMMRLPNGVGCSTSAGGENIFEGWGSSAFSEDPRSAMNGTTSVYRAMSNVILQPYGPWLTTLSKNDPVALVVSERQMKIDNWPGWLGPGRHYTRLYEAYLTLLHCHYPASLVFTTDMTSTSLNGYKAVFLVDQWVELDPGVQTTLTNAHNAGAAIYYDGDCKDVDSVFSSFGATALGLSFNHFENLTSVCGNDYADLNMLNAIRGNESTVSTALTAITPPSTIGVDEVFTSVGTEEQARYVFVLNNNTPTAIDPGNLWNVSTFGAARVPISLTVTLPNVTGATVYDVFAKTNLGSPSGGNVTADLRSLPFRVFAILPKTIDHVQLTGPNTSVTCGQPFNWIVKVCDSTNTPLAASIPVHVQLLAADGVTILREQYAGATSSGVTGTFVLPANLVGGSPILKATELFTGMSSSQTISNTTIAQQTLPLQGQTGPSLGTPVSATLATNGTTADPTAPIAQNAFGPHIRDIAISSDGSQVLCGAMNWDHNLYAVNLSTGVINWRQRAGMYFTFCPQATSNGGFAVQGYNFGTAEGYGMYLINSSGTLNMRFNSYGIARRDIGWLLTTPVESDPTNNFTASPDGSWVATAGNLGLAVWNSSGTLLWSQSWPDRHVGRVLALSTTALLVSNGMTVTSYNTSTGVQNWQTTLATTPGIISKAVVSSDGSTVALLTTNQGGATYVLTASNGTLAATFPSGGQDLGITSTGSLIAVAYNNQLKLYSKTSGLQWVFQDDSYVRFPRFSADNTKIVCTSDLGAVDVLDTSGNKLFERDMGALCAAAWHSSGDLILASWEGAVYRLTAGTYAQAWSTLLTPTATDMRNSLMTSDGAPVTKMTNWSNALATPYGPTPNLVSPTTVYLSYTEDKNPSASFVSDVSCLFNGTPTPPANPWVAWDTIFSQEMNGTSTQTHLALDLWNTMMQLNAITLFEDPNNPQSWLRDATISYWDVPSQSWKAGPALLSDAATHTHVLATPLQTPRIGITLPPGCPGNIRLGQIVLSGSLLGCSHPDVVAGHNTCVLFDENTFPFQNTSGQQRLEGGGWNFQYSDAYSGAMCLVKTDTNLVQAGYDNTGPFHYSLQDWNMKIVQTPQNANEYRYLQFAWKAVDANVTGITLEIGNYNNPNSFASIYCGTWCGQSGWPGPCNIQDQISSSVPTSWQLVTVDLWSLFQSVGAQNITYIDFGSTGGSGKVEFDAIKLFKTNPTGQAYTAPTAAITAPANNAQFSAPASVGITATASDTNSGGSITKVEFYNGDALLSTATSSPYSFTWTNVPAGSYALTARAYDNFGMEGNSSVVNITVNNNQCSAPSFSPAASTYGTAQNVTISTTTGGASICYTTDGSTPTESGGTITHGTLYSAPVNISVNTTLQAIAYKVGMTDSSVTSGVYNIQCAAPSFNPVAGTYGSAQTVTLSTTTSGATIRYTTDGSTPSESNGTVGTSVTISQNSTLQAIAYKTGMADSGVTSGLYNIQCAAPSFNPAAGTYGSAQTVTISSATSGATIRYTTDGSTPSESNGTVGTSVTISATTTLKAIAYKSGMSDSPVTSGVYTINSGSTSKIEWTTAGTWTTPQTQPGDLTVSNLLVDGGAVTYDTRGSTENGWLTGHAFTFNLTVPAGQTVTINSWALTDWNDWTNIEPQCSLQITGGTNASLGSGNFTQGNSNGTYTNYTITVTPTPVVLNPGTYTFTLNAIDPNCGGNGGWCGWYDYTINLAEGSSTCATPTYNPVAGTYGSAQNVTISTTTGGASICYTTDGSTPTESGGTITHGTLYSAPVNISVNTTLQAITYKVGMTDSSVASGVYNIQCAAPSFSPVAGTYGSAQTVTLSTTTSGATIRYTTDGSTPTESNGTVGTSVTISVNTTLKAIAYKTGMTDSLVTSGVYNIQCATPTFSPVAGTYGSAQTVTISTTTSGATIRYTTDGSTPSETNGTVGTSVTISVNTTLQAIAYKSGMADSPVTSGVYNIQCAAPTYSPVAGTYASAQTVTISTTTSGATIRYTTDGSTPTESNGTVGTSVTISVNTTLKAIAYKSGMADSPVTSGVYNIQCAAPSYSPTAGTFTTSTSVTITSGTSGATIRYTIDGSTPTETNGTVYSTAVSITATTTLKAIAYKTGMADSPVTSGVYTIQCATPTYSPVAGTYTSAQTVTISSATSGVTMRYTTDGSTPSESNGTVGTSVTISSTCTLQAIAYKSGLTDSGIASGVYTINALPTTGMLLWLKADAITGVSNGGSVSTWNDSSGNARNAVFTQVGGVGVAPLYETNVYNGMPVVRFAGNSLLQVSSLPLGTYTVATVFKTTGNSQIVYEHSDNTLTNTNGSFLWTSTQSTISVKRGGAQTGKDILGAGASSWAANCTTPILTVDEFGGTDATELLYINGAQQSLLENWTGNINSTTATTQHFNIGERASYGGLQFNGDIAEIVVYDHALSTSDFNTLNAALKAKYALDTPPTVSITAPSNNASYTAPASVTITASATANTGTISKVEFYDGTVLLGSVTSSPYTYTWSNAETYGASFALTAKAYDSNGFATVSSPVNITVNDTNLKAFWKFDEDTGATANDSSGTGNTGTVANGSWLPGKINCCLSFNGTSSSVQKTSATGLPAANGTQTIGFWMYVSATPSAKATVVAVSGSSSGVFIGYNSSTTFGVWKNAGTLLVSTTTLPSVNTWHYITYVLNGTTNYLYIDGTQVNTSTTATDTAASTTLTAGMTPGGTNYFSGDLDEIRVYTRALSAAEISGLAAGKQ